MYPPVPEKLTVVGVPDPPESIFHSVQSPPVSSAPLVYPEPTALVLSCAAPHTPSSLLAGVTLTVGAPDVAVAAPWASNVVAPPVVSFPENSSPNIDVAEKFAPPVNVTVNVTLVVLGDIAHKEAADATDGHVVIPEAGAICVNVHPEAVIVTPVGSVFAAAAA